MRSRGLVIDGKDRATYNTPDKPTVGLLLYKRSSVKRQTNSIFIIWSFADTLEGICIKQINKRMVKKTMQ